MLQLEEMGQRIRARREKRGLKQQDIAAALQVSPQAVSKWERGENAPDITLLAPLARLLGVSVDWLLSAAEERDVFPAAVLVSSVRGAYEKSLGMEPSDFAAWANGLFLTLTETTLRHDGVPLKYMGDQYLCFFSGADHCRRAVETALRAKRLISEDLYIGLSAGPVYLGSVGHPDYARPDIMGETVNIAFLTQAWAESHAPSGVAATRVAAEGATDEGLVLRPGKSSRACFKGIANPVEVREIAL